MKFIHFLQHVHQKEKKIISKLMVFMNLPMKLNFNKKIPFHLCYTNGLEKLNFINLD
jgi:hypothetical protein